MSYLTSDPNQTDNIDTIIRPPYFFISGFIDIPHMEYYYVFLCFVYIISLVGNTFVMMVIYMDNSLHSPKYIAVFNLAFADVCGSTAMVPKLLDMFLFSRQLISYNQCLTSLFFIFLFLTMQSFNLTILSYDRLVAICCPLRYHMIVTHRSMFQLMGAAWAFAVFLMLLAVCLITRLSFCRVRALKTCTSHLILVAIFYLPVNFTYFLHSIIPTNARIINLSLTSVLPPMLNPIIYVLKTEEFKESAKKLLSKRRAQRAVVPIQTT
ncbi:olfactory receptor 2D3-like isoform X1 [Oncorhynchus nerka]|uniref:olfactory receptor 2D3-like isoform X1 n=1 Tax=Oncorhynchus nerka TaxID=8023 RepID=UPI0011328FCB|nr:olfactory receptor 2D3-like isoform X1 [Oncorhynchus nerka]